MFISGHGAPDVVCQASLQATSGFARRLALSDLVQVVEVAAAAGHADLGHRGGVQRRVQLPITGPGQTVAGVVGAGDLDRCGTDVVGVGARVREPAGSSGPGDEAPGDDRADAHDVGQAAAGVLDLLGDGFAAGLQPGVQGPDLGDEVSRDGLAGSFCA